MPKKGKKQAQKEEPLPPGWVHPQKIFYESTIAELNKRLSRYRSTCTDFENKNEDLKINTKKLDDDRNDVIAHLKRTLEARRAETKAAQKWMLEVEQKGFPQVEVYNKKIQEQDMEYKQMQEQLASEIKLLTGKLNAQDEFRLARTELMKKFEQQENILADQAQRHLGEVYEVEKKFILGKDKIKKQMEARLVQLSAEFQGVTEIRIASTTHQVMNENITRNRELDEVLAINEEFYAENTKLKAINKRLKLEEGLYKDEKDMALAKERGRYNAIEKLTKKHDDMIKKIGKHKITETGIKRIEKEMAQIKNFSDKLRVQIRILEQNLCVTKSDRTSLQADLSYCENEIKRLSDITSEALLCTTAALQVGREVKDNLQLVKEWDIWFYKLLTVLRRAREEIPKKPSLESVKPESAVPTKEDTGFTTKLILPRTKDSLHKHQEAQVGASFEEFLELYGPSPSSSHSDIVCTEEEECN